MRVEASLSCSIVIKEEGKLGEDVLQGSRTGIRCQDPALSIASDQSWRGSQCRAGLSLLATALRPCTHAQILPLTVAPCLESLCVRVP